MVIEDKTLERARLAWVAVAKDDRELAEAVERLVPAREELRRYLEKVEQGWRGLSPDARRLVEQTAEWRVGHQEFERALLLLRETVEDTKGVTKPVRFGRWAGVNIGAIRAVATKLGLRSYGAHKAPPTPDERRLLEVCRQFDGRVDQTHVRTALKHLPREHDD